MEAVLFDPSRLIRHDFPGLFFVLDESTGRRVWCDEHSRIFDDYQDALRVLRRRRALAERRELRLWGVYVIGSEERPDRCKIGVSNDVWERLRSFKTGSLVKLRLHAVYRWSDSRALDVGTLEGAVHRRLSKVRLDMPPATEVYAISPGRAMSVIESWLDVQDVLPIWLGEKPDPARLDDVLRAA